MNEVGLKALGLTSEEVKGRVCHQLWHHRDKPCLGCPAQKTLETGLIGISEYMAAADGRIWEIITNPVKDDQGQVIGLVETANDVTEKTQARESIQRENAKRAAIISTMEEGVAFVDEQDTLTEVNDFFCWFMGLEREQVLNGNVWEVFRHSRLNEEDCSPLIDLMSDYRSGRDLSPYVRQQSIGDMEVIFRAQPIFRSGRYDGVLFSLINVTELVRARVQAESASQAKSDFLANMSHEIRTPMTAILGYVDLLSDPGMDPSEQIRNLAIVRRNGEHLLALINDILDLSKIEQGGMDIEKTACSVISTIAEVASMMRVRANEKQITLKVEFENAIPEIIWTDGQWLRQILVNLAGNAIKFTHEGGVTLRSRFEGNPESHEGTLFLSVEDTGIGIPEDKRDSLFEPFMQVDTSTSRKYGGTGLGLAIVRSMVNLLGGKVTLRSEEGKGSIFTVAIPTGNLIGVRMIAHPEEAMGEIPTPSSMPQQSLEGIRLLLAEDGEDNQRLIKTILSKAGAEVDLAANGALALEQVHRNEYDVILMDMQMPVMDGYAATKRLRQEGYVKPILALTAHAMAEDKKKCLEIGCDDHLTKPINRIELLNRVAEYAARSRQLSFGGVTMQNEPLTGNNVVESEYAGDPDLADILNDFVNGLPKKLQLMREAHANQDFSTLQRLAHQSKGAGGGYGYPALTQVCRVLEEEAKKSDPEMLTIILNDLDQLIQAIVRGSQIAVRNK
jgi:PAS domain S-box-containing protein